MEEQDKDKKQVEDNGSKKASLSRRTFIKGLTVAGLGSVGGGLINLGSSSVACDSLRTSKTSGASVCIRYAVSMD